jgi:hypothetical protein
MSDNWELQAGTRYLKDGTENKARSGLTGELCIDRAHPKYYEAVSRGNVYHTSMQAGASLGTALTASAVTLTLYNPINSGKNLVLIAVSVAITTVPSVAGTAMYVLAANVNPFAAAPTTTTAASIRNCLLGGANGIGLAYTVATLPAIPVAWRMLNPGQYWASAIDAISPISFTDTIDGSAVLAPNSAVTVQGLGQASSGIVSIIWEEVPI